MNGRGTVYDEQLCMYIYIYNPLYLGRICIYNEWMGYSVWWTTLYVYIYNPLYLGRIYIYHEWRGPVYDEELCIYSYIYNPLYLGRICIYNKWRGYSVWWTTLYIYIQSIIFRYNLYLQWMEGYSVWWTTLYVYIQSIIFR